MNTANIEPKSTLKRTPADELKKMIRKLRWVGMEKEAELLCLKLSRLSGEDTVLDEPPDTD